MSSDKAFASIFSYEKGSVLELDAGHVGKGWLVISLMVQEGLHKDRTTPDSNYSDFVVWRLENQTVYRVVFTKKGWYTLRVVEHVYAGSYYFVSVIDEYGVTAHAKKNYSVRAPDLTRILLLYWSISEYERKQSHSNGHAVPCLLIVPRVFCIIHIFGDPDSPRKRMHNYEIIFTTLKLRCS